MTEPLETVLTEILKRAEEGHHVTASWLRRHHPESWEALFDLLSIHEGLESRRTGSGSLGPYRLVREIGEGGMGTVHLAEVTADTDRLRAGERVAVKVLRSELLTRRGFFRRFLREAELGKTIRHPNVVRTFDIDAALVEGRQVTFLVMEYVEGNTLGHLLVELGSVPEALLREIGLQAASGLDAIHRAGVVHRDLKPSNVLITGDRRLRIMDLGIARLVESTMALTRTGQFIGTVLYSSPEQLEGGDVGPCSDLYSLGVILLELATGKNPFQKDDLPKSVAAHLGRRRGEGWETAKEISPFFLEVVETLLALDPSERFPSAARLRTVLEEGEESTWWAGRERRARRRKRPLPRISVRRETAVYGRASEIGLLVEAWARAREGHGSTILLEGEPGIGKTRLVHAFLEEIGAEDAHLLYGSYPPMGGLGGLSDAIVDHFGAANLEEALAPYLRVTPRLMPAFAALVRRELPPEDSLALKGDTLHAVLVNLLKELAAEKPLLWVVDDLHFAESESRKLVLSLARAVQDHRVLLLGCARPGIPEDEIAHFSRLRNVRRIRLKRLERRDVVELLREALGSDSLAERFGGTIADRTDGVPYFVHEMVRGLRDGGILDAPADGAYLETGAAEAVGVPSAVRDLVAARLHGLADEHRSLLDLACVQGFEFDPALIAQVRGQSRIAVLEKLAALERQSGIVQARGRSYRFDHHQVQEVLHEELSTGLREEYHAALADAFAELNEGDWAEPDVPPGASAHFLARHHLEGTRPVAAVPFLEGAFRHLQSVYQNDDAVRLAGDALGHRDLLTGRRRLALLLDVAEVLDLLGRRKEEHAALAEAVELSEEFWDPQLQARAHRQMAWHLYSTGKPEEAGRFAQEAVSIARAARELAEDAAASRILGNLARESGGYDEARRHFEWVIQLSRDLDDLELEGAATSNLGIVLADLGHSEEAREHFQRAISLAQEAGNPLGEGNALGSLGNLHLRQGRSEDASECHRRHLEIARSIGYRRAEGTATGNLGAILFREGRYDEARARFERWLAIARETGDLRGQGKALGNLGLVFVAMGRFEQAREHCVRWLAQMKDLGNRKGEAHAVGHLGVVCASLGLYGQALGHIEEQLTIAEELGYPRGQGMALLNLGWLLSRLGDPEAARTRLTRCRELAEGLGDRTRVASTIHGLGEVAEQAGDTEEAAHWFEEALGLRRELSHTSGEVASLVARGRVRAATGHVEEAAADLREALEKSRALGEADKCVLAAVHLARVSVGEGDRARELLAEAEPRLDHATRMEAHHALWCATSEPEHLAASRRILDEAVESAPERFREAMLDGVALHRAIHEASDAGGAAAPSG